MFLYIVLKSACCAVKHGTCEGSGTEAAVPSVVITVTALLFLGADFDEGFSVGSYELFSLVEDIIAVVPLIVVIVIEIHNIYSFLY